MIHKNIRQVVFPLLTALIWGSAFVFQSQGAQHIGPFTFNTLRCFAATVFLLLVLAVRRLWRRRHPVQVGKDETKAPATAGRRTLWLGGVLCGLALSAASNLQQSGLGQTAPGKAAFITAMYVVLVPVAGLLFGRKPRPAVWLGVVLGVAGLYFLCLNGKMTLMFSDLLVLLCAVAFTVQIMLIDHFAPRVDGVAMSCIQFAVVTLTSGVGMLFEHPTIAGIVAAAGSLLYVGVLSGGVGYTLQILAQKNADPTIVSLLLSLESVFAVLTDGLLTGRWLTVREWIGCALMMAAVLLAQDLFAFPKKKA